MLLGFEILTVTVHLQGLETMNMTLPLWSANKQSNPEKHLVWAYLKKKKKRQLDPFDYLFLPLIAFGKTLQKKMLKTSYNNSWNIYLYFVQNDIEAIVFLFQRSILYRTFLAGTLGKFNGAFNQDMLLNETF